MRYIWAGGEYNVSNTNRMKLLFTSIYAYKVAVNRQAVWVGELPETGGRLNCTYYSQSVLSYIDIIGGEKKNKSV